MGLNTKNITQTSKPHSVEIFGSCSQDTWKLIDMTGIDYLWAGYERKQRPKVYKHKHKINSSHLM